MQIFTLSRRFRYFILVISILIAGSFSIGLIWWAFSTRDYTNAIWVVPMTLMFVGGSIWMLQEARVGRLILEKDVIRQEGTVVNRELLLNQVLGFRTNDKYIYIYPVSPSLKRIKVSTSLDSDYKLREWLAEHYTDLDSKAATDALEAVLNDTRYGNWKEDREALLRKAVLTSRIINITSVIVSMVAYFWTGNTIHAPALIVAIAIPWIAIGAIYYYNGLITIDAVKGGQLPSLQMAFIPVTFSLPLTAFRDATLLHKDHLWAPFIAVVLLFALLLFVNAKRGAITQGKQAIANTVGTYLFLLPAISYGTLVNINCYFDNRSPSYFETQVVRKKITTGKSKSYYLYLAPWGPLTDTNEIMVSKRFFEDTPENKTVAVYLKPGLLNIPWYEVGDAVNITPPEAAAPR